MGRSGSAGEGTCCDVPHLLQLFEGFGENCDFGVVQRAVGIEPFGLFRFAGCTAVDLVQLLRSRFEPLGEPEDVWLDEVAPQREYCVRSRRFSFEAHTEAFVGRDDPQTVQAAQTRKLRFLKAQLLRDLTAGRKILVHKGDPDTRVMQRLAEQLQMYGPNTLLWVGLANAEHPPGTVHRAGDGVLRGFVGRFGTYDGDPSLPIADWVAVCANAYRLRYGEEPSRATLDNLIVQAMAAQWVDGPHATTRPLDACGPAGGPVLEHRLGTNGQAPLYHAHLPLPAGGPFVFSLWIRIPETFRGRRIEALLHGFPTAAAWPADLRSRGQWQRIWVTATLPDDARGLSCGLVADGAAGDLVQSAAWCLERGTRPMGHGFAA